MIPILALVKKELTSVIRDRTILIAILLQLFIASFSSGLLLSMLSLYDADTILRFRAADIRIGVVEAANNPLGTFLANRGLTVILFDTLPQAEAAFYDRTISAIVASPLAANGLTEIKLYLPESNTSSSLIRAAIQEPLKEYENYLRAQKGIEIHYGDLQGEPSTSFEFIYSILLPLLMFFPAFVGGSLSIDSLTEEVENNTLHTLLSTPLTINGMVSAKILSVVILSVVQCGAWLILLRLNGIAIHNIGWIFLLALIVSGITATSAALCAILFKDRERSQFIYALILLAAVALSNLLNLSPIVTLSRLAIGDHFLSGWTIAWFAIFLTGMYWLLSKASRRLIA